MVFSTSKYTAPCLLEALEAQAVLEDLQSGSRARRWIVCAANCSKHTCMGSVTRGVKSW
uniref:Uncharacterized protein n=1 Tax=Arundo donax TaxID=35708 RepID=A0A0A9FXF0_ARUDO